MLNYLLRIALYHKYEHLLFMTYKNFNASLPARLPFAEGQAHLNLF